MDIVMFLPLDPVHRSGAPPSFDGHKDRPIDRPSPEVLLQLNYIPSAAITDTLDQVLD